MELQVQFMLFGYLVCWNSWIQNFLLGWIFQHV